MVEFVRQQLYAENFSAYIIESSDVIFCGFDIVQILDDITLSWFIPVLFKCSAKALSMHARISGFFRFSLFLNQHINGHCVHRYKTMRHRANN